MRKFIYFIIVIVVIFNLTTFKSFAETIMGSFDVESKEKISVSTQDGSLMKLPYFKKRFLIPRDSKVAEIRIIYHNRVPLSYIYDHSEVDSIINNAIFPNFDHIIQHVSTDIFRGHKVILLELQPIYLDEETKNYFVIQSADFEIKLEAEGVEPEIITRVDKSTLNNLSSMVDNYDDFSIENYNMQLPIAMSTGDSIPFIIITNNSMKSVFQNYADFKTNAGVETEVKTISEIEAGYSGDSLQVKIRNYIIDCYNNKYTDWVLLGGDVDIIPYMLARTKSMNVITDLYYSNLDNNWNEDDDDYFGETTGWGDTVDNYPDVFVGRIPCSDSSEAHIIMNKIITYQSNAAVSGYQTDVMFFGTNILYPDQYGDWYPRDGLEVLQDLLEYIPSSMNTELYYEQESSFIKGKLNDGKGLLINLSQAQGHDNFLTHWTNDLATHAPDIRDRVDYTFFRDTISNVNKYSFFFNYTCYNNMLNQTNPISRHFMQTQNGGGIGYIGSTTYDFSSTEYPELNESMLDLIFNDSVFEVGKALALSKVAVIPEVITDPWIEWNGRTAMFSFLYLGDPQLKIYTDTPQIITITCPDSLGRGDYQTVHVKATSGGQDLSGAQVCLHMPDNNPEIYKIGTTDDTGTVDFSLNLTQTGNISVVVTKDNYFYTVDSAIVTNLGCCDGNTGNANCSASDAPDISDITRIYDYLYLSHAPLCCFEEADCNGDGTVDISDYVRLIDYLYGSHNPLTQCP